MLAEILRFKYIGMKECYRKTTSCTSRNCELPFLSALHAKNDTTNLFGVKLGESTENMQQSPTFLLR